MQLAFCSEVSIIYIYIYDYNLIAGNINFQQSGFILAITPFKLGANFGLQIDISAKPYDAVSQGSMSFFVSRILQFIIKLSL